MRLDVDEGIRLGVTVTPAFFINGQLIVGLSSMRALYLLSVG
jgi:protein-disulfide isomerase